MDQPDDKTKQQTDQQLQELQKRRILEQRRAAFYAQKSQELEQAQEAQRQEKENKAEAQRKLRQQILLAKYQMRQRAA